MNTGVDHFLDACVIPKNECEIAEEMPVSEELNSLKEAYKDCGFELMKITNEYKRSEKQKAKLLSELDITHSELKLTQRERDELLRQNDELREKINGTEKKIKEQDQLIAQWTCQADTLFDSTNTICKELSDKTKQNEFLTQELNKKIDIINVLQPEIEKLRNQLKNDEVSKTQQPLFVEQINDLSNQLNVKSVENSIVQSQLDAEIVKNQTLQSEIDSLQKQVKSLRTLIRALQSKNADIVAENSDLKSVINTKQRGVDSHGMENQTVPLTGQNDTACLPDQISNFVEEIISLKAELDGKASQISQLTAELKNKDSMLITKEASITNICQLLEEERKQRYRDAEKSNKLLKDYEKTIVKLHGENKTLKTKYSSDILRKSQTYSEEKQKLMITIQTYEEERRKLVEENATLSIDRQRKIHLERILKELKTCFNVEIWRLKEWRDQISLEFLQFQNDNIQELNDRCKVVFTKLNQLFLEFGEHQNRLASMTREFVFLAEKINADSTQNEIKVEILNETISQRDELEIIECLTPKTERKKIPAQFQEEYDKRSVLERLAEEINRNNNNFTESVDKNELEFCKDQYVRYKNEVDDLNEKIEQLETVIASLNCDWQQKYSEAEETITTLTTALAECQSNNSGWGNNIKMVTKEEGEDIVMV